MKRQTFWLLVFAIIFAGFCHAQPSSSKVSAGLTAACTNATTTCDATANSQLKFGVGEYSLASITVKGSFTGATISFEFSDDGGVSWFPTSCTRNDSAIQELSEAAPDNTNRSWDCGLPTGNASFFRVRLAAISTGGPTVSATLSSVQIEPAPTVSSALPNTQFKQTSNPAAGTQATASQAAAGTNLRNVATLACFSAGATTAPAAIASATINLRDGATGAGTVLLTWTVIIPAATGQSVVPFCVNLPAVMGSTNTAMTLEFSAGVSNTLESVSLLGYTTP